MNPASLVSRVDVYADLNVAWYLCPSGPELLFRFSVRWTQWRESTLRFKHMHIHKQLTRLEKSVVCSLLFTEVTRSDCPGHLIAGISWGLVGALARWGSFLHYLCTYCKTISLPYLVSLSQSAFHSLCNFLWWFLSVIRFLQLIWKGTVCLIVVGVYLLTYCGFQVLLIYPTNYSSFTSV